MTNNEVAAQPNPAAEIVFHMQRGSVVNLENFPSQTTFSFSVKSADGYISSLEASELQVFEDGYSVGLEQSDIETTHHPISFAVIFDYAPGQGAETHLPDVRELQDMVRAITGQIGAANTSIPSSQDDTWLFCSTIGSPECFEEKGSPQTLSFGNIHQGLFGHGGRDVPLSVLLRQALSQGENVTRQLIIVKVRPQAETPYISDALITELLLADVPVALINLTERNDSEMFKTDLRARLQEIGGYYYESGGDLYWEHLMGNNLPQYRPTSFRVSYHSRLFRDERTHTVLLGYETQDVRAWGEAEFRFLSEEQVNNFDNKAFSKLDPAVTFWNVPLTVALFFFLMILLIWSVEEPRESRENRRPSGAFADSTIVSEEPVYEADENQAPSSVGAGEEK